MQGSNISSIRFNIYATDIPTTTNNITATYIDDISISMTLPSTSLILRNSNILNMFRKQNILALKSSPKIKKKISYLPIAYILPNK